MRRRYGYAILIVSVWLTISACQARQVGGFGGTRAWIDIPRERSVLSLAPHQIIAHASDASGLQQVELVVNGENNGAIPCEDAAQPLVTCRVMWNPPAPGEYRLAARAINPNGNVGVSAAVNIVIRAETTMYISPTPAELDPTRVSFVTSTLITPVVERVSTATVTPPLIVPPAPATPSSTPTHPPNIISPTARRENTPTASPLPSNTPTGTGTATLAPTPTHTATPACPGAPIVTSFNVAPVTIFQGQSSTLSWGAVLNATSVEIDQGIGGVGTPGVHQVGPPTTTTYTLTARGCGGTVTRPVTLQVHLPSPTPTRTLVPDTQGPPAPQIVLPANNAQLECTASIKLVWIAPTDPSGIADYRVRLQKRGGGDYADAHIWDPVTSTQLNATNETECGNFYRWRLLARDGAGNQGDVSEWAYFSLKLD